MLAQVDPWYHKSWPRTAYLDRLHWYLETWRSNHSRLRDRRTQKVQLHRLEELNESALRERQRLDSLHDL
jgi:hypothetical protein